MRSEDKGERLEHASTFGLSHEGSYGNGFKKTQGGHKGGHTCFHGFFNAIPPKSACACLGTGPGIRRWGKRGRCGILASGDRSIGNAALGGATTSTPTIRPLPPYQPPAAAAGQAAAAPARAGADPPGSVPVRPGGTASGRVSVRSGHPGKRLHRQCSRGLGRTIHSPTRTHRRAASLPRPPPIRWPPLLMPAPTHQGPCLYHSRRSGGSQGLQARSPAGRRVGVPGRPPWLVRGRPAEILARSLAGRRRASTSVRWVALGRLRISPVPHGTGGLGGCSHHVP